MGTTRLLRHPNLCSVTHEKSRDTFPGLRQPLRGRQLDVFRHAAAPIAPAQHLHLLAPGLRGRRQPQAEPALQRERRERPLDDFPAKKFSSVAVAH